VGEAVVLCPARNIFLGKADALVTGENFYLRFITAGSVDDAIAKIAGIKLCDSYNRQYGTDYRSVMPTNLYGNGDNYHPQNSHVIPALIRCLHEAKINGASVVTIWGTGTPHREFLSIDDRAAACVHFMNLDKATYSPYLSNAESYQRWLRRRYHH